MPASIRPIRTAENKQNVRVPANESAPIGFMGCGISSNSPVVTKSRLAGRTSRVEDCSPLEQPTNQLVHPLHRQSYASANGYPTNDKAKSPITDPNSPEPMIANPMSSLEQQSLQFDSQFAKSQRGITAVLSKTLSNGKSVDQLESESDRQTGKESVETNNSRNDSNYGSSYSAEMSKTPVGHHLFSLKKN